MIEQGSQNDSRDRAAEAEGEAGAATAQEDGLLPAYAEFSLPRLDPREHEPSSERESVTASQPFSPRQKSSLYAHLDLLPDTSIAPAGTFELDAVIGRPAWLCFQKEASEAEQEADLFRTANFAHNGDEAARDVRDARVSSRWFALKRIFHGDDDEDQVPLTRLADGNVPAMAVFSLAGGVGKTSLVATLGRALAAHGERVLLVDTTSSGLLPIYYGARQYGAREARAGLIRTFSAPGSADASVNMIGLHGDQAMPGEGEWAAGPRWGEQSKDATAMPEFISRHARGASRVLIDLDTASRSVASRLLKLMPTILVPVTPDMNSVVSLAAIEAYFREEQMHGAAQKTTRNEEAAWKAEQGSSNGQADQEIPSAAPYLTFNGRSIRPYYLINEFDPSLPLHLDIREVMRQQVGDRLLPFTVRRNPVVSEAMAQGMTVIDYAPSSSVAEDYMTLAAWIRSVAAPASLGYRGVRWSEQSV